jgi:type VI secretion system protein ImpL
MKIARFWGAILVVVALGLLTCLWFYLDGARFGLATDAQRWCASLIVASICVVLLVAKEAFMPTWRKRQDTAQESLRPPSDTCDKSTATRHTGLLALRAELRCAHGPFWRYRMRWLMLHGSDERIDEVAPGLKQTGVMQVGNVVLVHAAPEGIETSQWRRQLRQLRRSRPVDSVVHVRRAVDDDTDLPRSLATLANDLGWAAPVTFLHAVPTKGDQTEQFEAVGVFVSRPKRRRDGAAPDELNEQLAAIEYHTADMGVRNCCASKPSRYLAQVSAYIGAQRERIVSGWAALIASPWLRAPLDGVMFVPVFAPSEKAAPAPLAELDAHSIALSVQPALLLPTWEQIGGRLHRHQGRRVGFHGPNALATLITVLAIGWCGWMTVSFIGNERVMSAARASADAALTATPGTPAALRAQLALQLQIDTLEYRQQHGAPWYLRAGLNRNSQILDALWQPYRTVAERNMQRPVVQALQTSLTQFAQIRADALQSHDAQQRGYNALKAYLMLADPHRVDPEFLKRELLAVWRAPAGMIPGEWLDTSQQLAGFYADHLKAHPEWRINASAPVVTAARATLVNQIGLANADDTVYQSILDEAKGKYADASLATLLNGTDARGLFTTAKTVPGTYTRVAWEGFIAGAIDKAASERRTNGDWVLADATPGQSIRATLEHGVATAAALDAKHITDELKTRLTARYFAEYAAAWQGMLNSIQWQSATNLSGAIDQLTRLADAQSSPLIALMRSVEYQAQAGRASEALTDTLVRKAQNVLRNDKHIATLPGAADPLDKPFGPLLALMNDAGTLANVSKGGGDTPANPQVALSGVSLARYLTVVATMRLKLQAIAASSDPQAMARSLAQAVFQGKLSELTQAREDAAQTAASLGTQWAGLGDALYVRPLDTAWQTVLQPAAASLNEAWRASVAVPFATAFSGRYPFVDTTADASFAELSRYVRPDTGLIARFIATQLAGVLQPLGDAWVPNELAPQALQFDPAFLAALRQLSTLGAQLNARGDAGYRFEVMALPTPGVTRSTLSVDGQQIVYFNQRESYTPLAWPGNGLSGHAALMWESANAGLRQVFDATGDWAFLRLLAEADVKPLDSTRYQLIWNAPTPENPEREPLRYVLRTQIGAGPLDLLKLRGFKMPEQIFITQGGVGASVPGTPALPPLPPELQ